MFINLNKCQFIFIITLLSTTFKVRADNANFNHSFDTGIDTAVKFKEQPLSALQTFHPEKFIKNYTDNPKETDYKSSTDLRNDAMLSRDQNPIGNDILRGIDTRKSQYNYSIDSNSTELQNIQKKADNVYTVITGQFGDCTKQVSCTTNYETKVCEESPKSHYQYCQKILYIDLIPHQDVTHYTLKAHLSVKDHNYAGISINAVYGNINFIGPHDASFFLERNLPKEIDCNSLQGRIVSEIGDAHLDYINLPSCNNGLVLDFHISNGHRKDLEIDMTTTKLSYEAKDRWDDECIAVQQRANCSFQEEHCISSASTKDIQGMSLARDCWEKQASYFCGGDADIDTCQSYRNLACEQINSVCKNKNDSGCILFAETYRCPIKQCGDVGMICNGETYCLEGDCVKQQKQADPDFQRSITTLAAVNEAAKNYTANPDLQFPIFSGQVKTCNKDFINFTNCCAESGWGIDLNLGQCDQEAKDLGIAKEKGLTTYIDSEDDCTLGLCSHKKRYCVFPSKLARIIQENGRREQLHQSFGDFKHPNCRGLTPYEFGQLNLSKINFSEAFSDISKNVKLEDKNELNERVNEKIKEWFKEKTYHG